jgi:pimeloyl-ACP methyl ester carboxylesterase
MATDDLGNRAERRLIETATGALEVFVGGPIAPKVPTVCAAHPAGVFGFRLSPTRRAGSPGVAHARLSRNASCHAVALDCRFPDVATGDSHTTLVIGGSSDPIVPLPHVRSLHEAIAGSRFLIVEGAGHVPTTARRSEVTGAVRTFLRDCAR